MAVRDMMSYWQRFRSFNQTLRSYHPQRDMERSPFPKGIQVQTINACNASCLMCPYGETRDSRQFGEIDPVLWDKLVDEIIEHPEVQTFIPMLQNEPFLDTRILERIRDFKIRCKGRIEVNLVTHGGLLTPEVRNNIKESGVDLVSISLDTIDADTYRNIRVGLNHEQVMENIHELTQVFPKNKIMIRMVRQIANRNQVEDFVKYWHDRDVDVVVWDVTNSAGSLENYDQVKVPQEKAAWYSLVSNKILRGAVPYCPAPFVMSFILWNGDVLLCSFDWNHEIIIGNIRERPLSEIWTSEKMKYIRRMHYQKRPIEACGRCSLWKNTWGGQ
jgi:radical SAM protein with 4Fe4S-binding SPASM domain